MTEARAVGVGRATYVPALDGVRGVAILGVLLFHTGHLPGGFLGVDLFFALSGYLITDLLLREIATTGTVSLIAFWGRRVRRLLPALATMLVATTTFVWVVSPPDLVRTTLADGPWVQANLVNWHLLAESASYWDRFGSSRVFEHLWSIAVEEQFYLVWPIIVVVVARRWGRRGVLAAAAVGSVVSLVLMVVLLDPADPTRVYTGTDTRAFSLLAGAAVATGPVLAGRRRLAALAAAGIAVIWFLADGVSSHWLFTGGLLAHSVAAALLIGTAPRTVLAWRPLRWLGLISYSLYLWHWPVIVVLPHAGWLTVCAVSIALAALSKYLVEDPIRFRAGWARGRAGLVAFTAVMVALAILWLALPAPAPPVIDVGGLVT